MASTKNKSAVVSAKDLGATTNPTYGERKEANDGKQMLTGWLDTAGWSAVEALKARWGLSSNIDVVERALMEAYRGGK